MPSPRLPGKAKPVRAEIKGTLYAETLAALRTPGDRVSQDAATCVAEPAGADLSRPAARDQPDSEGGVVPYRPDVAQACA